MPKVVIDPDICVGTGECVRIAPNAFSMSPSADRAHPSDEASAEARDLLEKAAYFCPTGAITIEDD